MTSWVTKVVPPSRRLDVNDAQAVPLGNGWGGLTSWLPLWLVFCIERPPQESRRTGRLLPFGYLLLRVLKESCPLLLPVGPFGAEIDNRASQCFDRLPKIIAQLRVTEYLSPPFSP